MWGCERVKGECVGCDRMKVGGVGESGCEGMEVNS